MAFTLITVTFTDERPDAGAGQGTVTATLSEPIQNGTQVLDPTPIVGTLNPSGQLLNSSGLAFALIANDDTATNPQGSYYSFVLELDSAPVRQFDAVISHLAAGGTVDLSTLMPALP